MLSPCRPALCGPSPRLTDAQGTRLKQRTILTRTLQKSRSGAKAAEHGRRYEQTYHQPLKMHALEESVLDPMLPVATVRFREGQEAIATTANPAKLRTCPASHYLPP
jgi:hypothetical protein